MQLCAPIQHPTPPTAWPDQTAPVRQVSNGETLRPRIVLVAAFGLVALFGRLCYLAHPFDHDAACFIYMGKMTADGGRLGHDLVDNKFPTVGLITSAAWRGFGTWWPGYVILEAILSLASAAILGRLPLADSQTNSRSNRNGFPAFCFALLFLNFTSAVFGGFQLETIQIFFATIAAAGIVRANRANSPSAAFVAGMAGGCAAMLKPTGLVVLLAGSVCFVLNRRGPLLLVAIAAGLMIPGSVVLAYLSATGLLSEMPGLYRQISTYAANSVFDRIELLKVLTAVVLLGFPMLVAFRRGHAPSRATAGTNRQRDGSTSPMLFPALWLALALAGMIAQRRMYAYHFLPLVPPAAVLFGLVESKHRPRITRLVAALGPIAVLSSVLAVGVASDPGPARSPVADYLSTHARAGDAVWCEQWPRTVLQTGLSPGSRFASTFLFANEDSAGLDDSAVIVADFNRTRPQFIVLPADLDRAVKNQIEFIPELADRPARATNYATGWDQIRRYTLEHYQPAAEIDGSVIYRRCDRQMPGL